MSSGVNIDITANLSKFSSNLDRATQDLNRFQTNSQRIGNGIKGLFAGLSIAGLGAFVKSGVDAADALNDMADRTGIAVEQLAGFQLAAKLADTDMESLAASINKLSVNIGKSGDDFKKLGIDAKDPGEAFLQLADVMRSIDDPQKRAALGAKALGKSWAEMAPLLLQGSAALREQISRGREMSGITTAQAKAAADLNDKLDALGNQMLGMKNRVALGIVEPFADMAQAMDVAIERGGVLRGVLDGIVNGARNSAFGTGGGLSVELDDLNGRIVDAKEKLRATQAGDGSTDIMSAEYKLNQLLSERAKLLEKISNSRKKPEPQEVASPRSVDDFIGGGAEKNKIGAQKQDVSELSREYKSLVDNLSKEVALRGDNSEAAKIEYEIINGSLSGLSEGQKLKLLNLAAEKDAIELNTKAYEEYDQVVEDGLALAKKQRSEMGAEQGRLERRFDAPRLDLNAGISDAMDARAAGIIPDDEALKKVLDKMGRDYNDLTNDAKESTEQMSEFAVQAARNMESAFADFLFDPFKDGLDGMAVNFLGVIRRMAADAAAASIMDSLIGKSGSSGSGLLGTVLTSVIGGIAGAFGGGASVSTAAGNSEAFSSTMNSSSFWGARKFASGGDHSGGLRIVGENGPELEATGPSRIFNAEQTKAMLSGGGGGTVNNVNITVQAAKDESPASTGQKIAESFMRAIAKEEIMAASRPGNRLNPVTSF